MLNLYPSPTAGGIVNNFTSFPTVTNNSNGIDLRIDQSFGPRDSAFARYSYLDTDQLNPGPFQGIRRRTVQSSRKWSNAGTERRRE